MLCMDSEHRQFWQLGTKVTSSACAEPAGMSLTATLPQMFHRGRKSWGIWCSSERIKGKEQRAGAAFPGQVVGSEGYGLTGNCPGWKQLTFLPPAPSHTSCRQKESIVRIVLSSGAVFGFFFSPLVVFTWLTLNPERTFWASQSGVVLLWLFLRTSGSFLLLWWAWLQPGLLTIGTSWLLRDFFKKTFRSHCRLRLISSTLFLPQLLTFYFSCADILSQVLTVNLKPWYLKPRNPSWNPCIL